MNIVPYIKVHSSINIFSEAELDSIFDVKNGLIIDIRSKNILSTQSIKNSIHLDLMSEHFVEFFADIVKDKPLLIYCQDGSRSRIAIRLLLELDYTNLYTLKNGINQWHKVAT